MKWAVASLDAASTVPARKGSFESEGQPGRLCEQHKAPGTLPLVAVSAAQQP